MSAAEKLRPSRRQRRRDALVMAFTSFANQVADVLDDADQPEAENDTQPRARRSPVRAPYVPTHGQTPSPEAFEKAEAAARRRGIR